MTAGYQTAKCTDNLLLHSIRMINCATSGKLKSGQECGHNFSTSSYGVMSIVTTDVLYANRINGPYSLLVRASYFISYSVYTRSTSVIFIVCKWRWGCRYFLTSCISMPCSEAIRLIIR